MPLRYSRCSAVNDWELLVSGMAASISIDIALITFFGFEFCHVLGRLIGCFAACSLNYLMQRAIDIGCHSRGVAANVEMRAFFQPGPDFRSILNQSMLNINFLFLIAGKGDIEMGEMTTI